MSKNPGTFELSLLKSILFYPSGKIIVLQKQCSSSHISVWALLPSELNSYAFKIGRSIAPGAQNNLSFPQCFHLPNMYNKRVQTTIISSPSDMLNFPLFVWNNFPCKTSGSFLLIKKKKSILFYACQNNTPK